MTGSTQGRVDFHKAEVYDGTTAKEITVRFSRNLTVQTVGTGSVTWEATCNGSDWQPVQATRLSSGVKSQTATAAGIFQVECHGFDKFRVGTPSGFTSVVAVATS